jgi:hypothetical protein
VRPIGLHWLARFGFLPYQRDAPQVFQRPVIDRWGIGSVRMTSPERTSWRCAMGACCLNTSGGTGSVIATTVGTIDPPHEELSQRRSLREQTPDVIKWVQSVDDTKQNHRENRVATRSEIRNTLDLPITVEGAGHRREKTS